MFSAVRVGLSCPEIPQSLPHRVCGDEASAAARRRGPARRRDGCVAEPRPPTNSAGKFLYNLADAL